MKVVERTSKKTIRHQIDIDDMQFGFMKGKGTTDAIFIVSLMQERSSILALWIWKIAFDSILKEVIRWAI